MDKVWKEIKYWSQIFLLPVYLLSYLIPRSKKIWVFGSTFGQRFADNPKYFYLYISQFQGERIRSIWISKNRSVVELLRDNNLEAYYVYSLRGLWYSLTAKVYLFDNYSKDICFWLSGGAVKINMWHGIPLKKINMDNKFDLIRNPNTKWERIRYSLRRLSDEKPSHYVLTTSKYLEDIFSSAFATKNVITCGYPRNDNLTSLSIRNVLANKEKASLDEVLKRSGEMKAPKIVLYMPTFRDSEKDFFQMINRDYFNKTLSQNNIIFCIKPHPKSKVKKEYEQLQSPNVIYIDADADPYIYLSYAELLITDYSSIYFDYLLLNRPVIFFCYDLESYLSSSREMYFEYNEMTPGKKVNSFKELFEILTNLELLIKDTEMSHMRSIISKMVFGQGNRIASEMLYEHIQRNILKIDK